MRYKNIRGHASLKMLNHRLTPLRLSNTQSSQLSAVIITELRGY